VLSTGTMQSARVFSKDYFTCLILRAKDSLNKNVKEEINPYQHVLLDRKGCHTPLNKWL